MLVHGETLATVETEEERGGGVDGRGEGGGAAQALFVRVVQAVWLTVTALVAGYLLLGRVERHTRLLDG